MGSTTGGVLAASGAQNQHTSLPR